MWTYRALLAVPRVRALLASTLLARLPLGINGLAVVLYLRERTGSFAVAGAAAGALALGSAAGAPFAGRLVDRLGARVLFGLALAHAAALVSLVALGSSSVPSGVLVAAAGLAGIAFPPTGAVLRALYPRLLAGSEALIQTAFALDSVVTESLFVVGPLLTAAIVATLDPGAALLASAVIGLVGSVTFLAFMPPDARRSGPPRERAGALGALQAPGMRTLVLTMLPVGFAFGAVEVAIPAFAHAEGRPHLAGVLIAVWSIASAVGGLAYGARPRRASLVRVHQLAAILVAACFLPVVLATSPATMALLVIPAGFFIAPLIATRNELAGVVAPAGARTEAFTWPLTALVSGIAIGAAAAGSLVDASGWRSAVLAGAAAAAIGALVSYTRRATLDAPAPAPAQLR